MLIEMYIDNDEFEDYKQYCILHKIKLKIIYDCGYIVIVLFPIRFCFDYASWITIGECCLNEFF